MYATRRMRSCFRCSVLSHGCPRDIYPVALRQLLLQGPQASAPSTLPRATPHRKGLPATPEAATCYTHVCAQALLVLRRQLRACSQAAAGEKHLEQDVAIARVLKLGAIEGLSGGLKVRLYAHSVRCILAQRHNCIGEGAGVLRNDNIPLACFDVNAAAREAGQCQYSAAAF